MIRALATGLGLSLAVLVTPVTAAPNQQLVNSVQHRLNILGFSHVDAGELTTNQIGALHLRLQGNYTFGLNRVRARQEVKVILEWDGSQTKSP